jgi:hypothetical protein
VTAAEAAGAACFGAYVLVGLVVAGYRVRRRRRLPPPGVVALLVLFWPVVLLMGE